MWRRDALSKEKRERQGLEEKSGERKVVTWNSILTLLKKYDKRGGKEDMRGTCRRDALSGEKSTGKGLGKKSGGERW